MKEKALASCAFRFTLRQAVELMWLSPFKHSSLLPCRFRIAKSIEEYSTRYIRRDIVGVLKDRYFVFFKNAYFVFALALFIFPSVRPLSSQASAPSFPKRVLFSLPVGYILGCLLIVCFLRDGKLSSDHRLLS